MTLRCLIADDEPLAHEVLISYIKRLKSLQIVAQCYTAFEVLDTLRQHEIDLIFLDIQMPHLTGLEMLKTLKNPPIVILTTAYSEFSLEAFEVGVIDYLMKPIRFERFLKSVNRVLDVSKTIPPEPTHTPADTASYLLIKDRGITKKVLFEEILFAQAYGNFTKIYTRKEVIVASFSLKSVENQLQKADFQRVHKSFIVNTLAITFINATKICIDTHEIPIGETYRQIVNSLKKS